MVEQEFNGGVYNMKDLNDIDIPFGNSVYQIKTFMAEKTPERQYRNAALQLRQKYIAMKECEFRRKRFEIDIAEIQEKLLSKTNTFETQRLRVDLEEKQFLLDNEIKLIKDCLIEIAVYRQILKTLPKFNREDFEKAEPKYWKNRLISDAEREVVGTGTVGPGTLKSLEQVGIVVGRNEKGQIAYQETNENLLEEK